MEPQTFLLYSGLPKTSYHYYHLRVADEDRKVKLCNLCHDFPYLNNCNSIASLEILANSIPTGNRELPGVIFFSVQLFCHLIETIFRFNWLLNQNVSNLYSEPTTKPLLIGEGELFILSLDKSSLDSRPDLWIVSHLLISKGTLKRIECSQSPSDTSFHDFL